MSSQHYAFITDEIRDVVEGFHGRPKRKRGVVIVVSSVICQDSTPCWIAKVKFGALIVAKCGTPSCGHVSIENALLELLANTKRALGAR